jgi:RNA polymerase sigma-70 factor, ECF subfamily
MEKNELFIREFKPHLAALYSSAMRLTWNKVDAEELVYQTVSKMLVSMDTYTPGTNPLALMRTIQKNIFLNNQKKLKTRKTKSVDQEYILQLDRADEAAALDVFSALLEQYDTFGDEVVGALDMIRNDAHFQVFCLILDGYKSSEVAEDCGIPENTVKGIVRRVRTKLIPVLSTYAREAYGIVPDIKMEA